MRGFLTLLEDVDLRSAKPKNMTLDEFLPPFAKLANTASLDERR
jgi:hypothetical protein